MAESGPAPGGPAPGGPRNTGGDRRPGAPRRPTLGLVTANIHLGVGATLWSGVLAAAERNDANLVCLPGGPLRPGGAPRNALYELIGADRLDGVICWTSTLGLPAATDRAERLARRLRQLPVVSLNRGLDGHETLLLDSHAGMRQAVGHLVGTHGRRRPACIRGPLANPVSLDRYRAYTHALTRHRIPVDRSLVTAALDFGSGAGASAMRVLLDIRGLVPGRDFDALVACSDVLAADALRFLTGRGIRVPEDVAVISFNDSLEARLADPPLTSVALPFAELGALAVDTLIARLRGTRPPARSVVAGTLVTRRSCGCHSSLVTQGARDAAGPGEPPPEPVPPGPSRPALSRSHLSRSHLSRSDVAPSDVAPSVGAPSDLSRPDVAPSDAAPPEASPAGGERWARAFASLPRSGPQLAAAFAADLSDRGPGGAFLGTLERLIGNSLHTREDATTWDTALLGVRGEVIPQLPAEDRQHAERLLGQARLTVADKSHRLLEYERWAEEQESRRLRELGTTLTTATGMDALTGALSRHLPGTGVAGCRLALYEDGGAPGTARPVLTREEQRAPGERGAPYRAGLLLPDALLPPRDRRFTLVAEPLHIGDEQLGFALFDAGPGQGAAHRGGLYRALGDQISAALKGIRLFEEVRRARDAAEQANQLKTRLLDNATDELRTPVEAILRQTSPPEPVPPEPGPLPEELPDTAERTEHPERPEHPGRPEGRTPRTADAAPRTADAAPRTADAAPRTADAALRAVHGDAGRLLRLIDDLLDLSRSEIDALDLSRQLLDPRPVLVGAFETVAGVAPGTSAGSRRLRLPRRLPAVRADGARLRQIILNLLTAAVGHSTGRGRVGLTAEVRPPMLSVRIACPDLDVPPGEEETLFQPFASGAPGNRLGLAIARRLAVLHGGSVALHRGPGPRGFHLELPLPTPADTPAPAPGPADEPGGRGTLLVAAATAPPPEITAIARQNRLRPHRLHPDDDTASLLAGTAPAAVAWDAANARPHEWSPVQRLHDHPACRHTPFLLYGPAGARDAGPEPGPGLGPDLAGALHALRPPGLAAPVVVADSCAATRERLRRLLAGVLPGRAVRTAADGTAAAALLAEEVPCLLVVERGLTEMDGFDVVEQMYETAGAEQPVIPVLVLSDRGFTPDDVRRAEPHPGLLLLGRDILTDEELSGLLATMTQRNDPAAHRSYAQVRAALVHIEQHYRTPLTRWQIAQAAGVSENHLGRLFHRELGLTLWDYLTRLRVQRAKERLRQSDDSVQAVARAVGFHDRAYFSRVFRKVTGVAPHIYREAS